MVCQSNKALATVFYVPNDKAGVEFIKSLRFYLNRKTHRIRVRGRNENRRQLRQLGRWNVREFVPKGMSTYFAVYVDAPPLEEIANRYKRGLYAEIQQLRDVLKVLLLTNPQTNSILEQIRSLEQHAGRNIRLK